MTKDHGMTNDEIRMVRRILQPSPFPLVIRYFPVWRDAARGRNQTREGMLQKWIF